MVNIIPVSTMIHVNHSCSRISAEALVSLTQGLNFATLLLLLLLLLSILRRGGADKFLARPGRKQATATKLGIYSTYYPRSSIHFLARCSNFCKPLKKNSEGCPSNQVSAAAMTSASDEKWRLFKWFFSPGKRW